VGVNLSKTKTPPANCRGLEVFSFPLGVFHHNATGFSHFQEGMDFGAQSIALIRLGG
jgi:hypothetical protein